jgi:hypothetical protein
MRGILAQIGAVTLISGFAVGVTTASSAAAPAPRPAHHVARSADPVIVVSPGHPHGWDVITNHAPGGPYTAASANSSSTADHFFREGPGLPPLGEGSLELETGSESNSRVAAMAPGLAGKTLDSLTRLTYDTFLTQAGLHGEMPITFKIGLFSAARGGSFHTLVFEPARQQSGHGTEVGVWQAWDALAGDWWASGIPSADACSQAHVCTWEKLKDVIGGTSRILLPYFELGASGEAQAGTSCALDAVVIDDPTYDFEAEQRHGTGEETPEIPAEEGEVPAGQLRPVEVPVTG